MERVTGRRGASFVEAAEEGANCRAKARTFVTRSEEFRVMERVTGRREEQLTAAEAEETVETARIIDRVTGRREELLTAAEAVGTVETARVIDRVTGRRPDD